MAGENAEVNSCELFASYAGDDLEKWKLLIGQKIIDGDYNEGIVENVYRGKNNAITLVISNNQGKRLVLADLLRNFCECSLPESFQPDRSLIEEFERTKRQPNLGCIKGRIRKGKELDENEVEYLKSQGQHSLLARYCEDRFRITGDPWYAARASKHWRDAGQPEEALYITTEGLKCVRDTICKAAILTSRGGAFADLGRLHEAEKCGLEAERLEPNSCHTIHLLERVYSLMCNQEKFDEYKWKEQKLGCPPLEDNF